MAGQKVLVFGGTGPAGILLVRELIHHNFSTIIYARSPEKLPEELTQSPLVEVVKGDISNAEALSNVVSRCRIILSLLGPVGIRAPRTDEYANFYRNIFDLMRQHDVKRILAMTTVSIYRPEDKFALSRALLVLLVRTIVPGAYYIVHSIRAAFEDDAATTDIDWTLFRIGNIRGGSDTESWRRDRDVEQTYVGPVGAPGWGASQKRAALARWMVDSAETGAPELIREMPAVCRRTGT